jgi:PIN domain nuclease of toxin-antitoxin system
MSAVVADTHAALWYLLEPSQLSAAANLALTQADQTGAGIFVSAISVVEAIYLVEKGKLAPAALQALVTALSDPAEAMYLLPVDWSITQAIHQVPRKLVSDLPDRIIAATAGHARRQAPGGAHLHHLVELTRDCGFPGHSSPSFGSPAVGTSSSLNIKQRVRGLDQFCFPGATNALWRSIWQKM